MEKPLFYELLELQDSLVSAKDQERKGYLHALIRVFVQAGMTEAVKSLVEKGAPTMIIVKTL
jgi:hypothetical protein